MASKCSFDHLRSHYGWMVGKYVFFSSWIYRVCRPFHENLALKAAHLEATKMSAAHKMNNLKEPMKVLMLKLNEDDSTAATILESLNSFEEAQKDLKGLFDIEHEEGGSDGSCEVWQNNCKVLLKTARHSTDPKLAMLLTECLTKLESVHQELMDRKRSDC